MSMAALSPIAAARADQRNLSDSMDRVLKELENLRDAARNSADVEDAVHDLRTSIRRCRSIAKVMEEVDPDPAWLEMRDTAKRLFHGLGALRDAHVMNTWVQKLATADDPIAAQLLSDFSARKPQLRQDALRAARKFDEKKWQRLKRTLRRRSRLVAPGSLAAECLALERFETAKELHVRALRTEKPKPWHALRKSMKQFRYTVENLLPEHHNSWRENLKRIQDLLGEVHDFDVLAERVKSAAGENAEPSLRAWHEILFRERAERIAAYRQLMLGTTSLWSAWRHALPHGDRLQTAAMARLRVTARAADAHPRRTLRVTRIAKYLFDGLRRAKAAPFFLDAHSRQLLAAAASLHNVRGGNPGKSSRQKSPQKTAYRFLQGLAKPPGFPTHDWHVLLAAVRYHRGPEPQEKSAAFAKLSAGAQSEVRALAGVLRLARALRKSGVDGASRFRAESTPEAIILRVPALPDSIASAARLAAAKHLLEVYLERSLVLRPPPAVVDVPATPQPSVAQPELEHFAAASD
jgi:CHAD domain-containing protein